MLYFSLFLSLSIKIAGPQGSAQPQMTAPGLPATMQAGSLPPSG